MHFGKKAILPTTVALGKDRRGAERLPVNYYAVVVLPTGHQIRATVVHLSETGALLVMESVLGIPAVFDVQFAHGPKRRVRLVRRGPRKIAVEYL